MKENLAAIYETLKKLEMPMTPANAKHMAGIFIKLEQMYQELEKAEQNQQGEHGGD